MAEAFVALGSNMGDRLRMLQEAVVRLRPYGTFVAVSDVFETDPVGCTNQPAYLNAVLHVRTHLPPVDLLAVLLNIEAALCRTRTYVNAPRTLDLDLLFYDELILDTANLVLPHPRLHERAFVLVPLTEVAPDLVHPKTGLRVREMLSSLGDPLGVRIFTGGLHAHPPRTESSVFTSPREEER